MLALKIPLKDAEKWKKYLVDTDSFDTKYRFKKDTNFIYFPVKKTFEVLKGNIEFVEIDLEKVKTSGTLKENLSKKLSKEEMDFVKTAHDIIGNIAILEIPKDLEKHDKLIAETLLKTNKNIKTVLKISSLRFLKRGFHQCREERAEKPCRQIWRPDRAVRYYRRSASSG